MRVFCVLFIYFEIFEDLVGTILLVGGKNGIFSILQWYTCSPKSSKTSTLYSHDYTTRLSDIMVPRKLFFTQMFTQKINKKLINITVRIVPFMQRLESKINL